MKITDFLLRENCVASLEADEKEGAMRELCALLVKNGAIKDGEAVLEAVMSREKLGSTGIGEEVAIPHCKTDLVKGLVAAFGASREGVEFYSADGKPVKLVFLLLAGSDSASDHLKALARIARMVKNATFRKRIDGIDNRDEIYGLIAETDNQL